MSCQIRQNVAANMLSEYCKTLNWSNQILG